MGSQVSGAGSLSARPAGVSRWGRAGAGPGPLGAGARHRHRPPSARRAPPRGGALPAAIGALQLRLRRLWWDPGPVPELRWRGAGRAGAGRDPRGAARRGAGSGGTAPCPSPWAPPAAAAAVPPRHLQKGNFPAGNFCCVNARPQRRPGASWRPSPAPSRAPPPAPRSRTRTRRAELPRVGAAGGGCGRSPRSARPWGSLSPPEAGTRLVSILLAG